jgi:uncharacterized RDD family membrane protein YckC
MSSSGVFCTTCGQRNDVDAAFCSRCGAPQKITAQAVAVPPIATAPVPQVYTPPSTGFHGYGGFWIRFVAFIIDVIVVSVVTWPLRVLLFIVGFRPHVTFGNPDFHPMLPFLIGAGIFVAVVRFFVGWLYWAGMESSSYQATLGKMALGLKVTDMAGNRISFARATGRYFSKILSGMILFIGYMMAGFTERKQALHDMIAGTVVLKK